MNKEFLHAMLMRAIRTAAQVILASMSVGMMFHEVNWVNALSMAGTAAIYSVLTSVIAGIPEAHIKDIDLEKGPEITYTDSFMKSEGDVNSRK